MSRQTWTNIGLTQGEILAVYRGAQQIVRNVYLTSHEGANEDTIRRLNIKAVINCTTNLPHSNVPGVAYYRVPIEDSLVETASSYFEPVASIIEGFVLKGHPVLIHCQAGVSRSATCLLAYMISHHGLSLRDAFQHMKRRRTLVEPNPSFMEQLVSYEAIFRPQGSVRLTFNNGLPVADVLKDDPHAVDREMVATSEGKAMRLPAPSAPFIAISQGEIGRQPEGSVAQPRYSPLPHPKAKHGNYHSYSHSANKSVKTTDVRTAAGRTILDKPPRPESNRIRGPRTQLHQI